MQPDRTLTTERKMPYNNGLAKWRADVLRHQFFNQPKFSY